MSDSDKKKNFWTKTRNRQNKNGTEYTVTGPNWPNIILVLFCIFLLNIFWPLKIIEPTERGVIKTFGELKEVILEPGLRVKIPIAQKITSYDLTPSTVRVNVLMGEDGAVSLDKQTIGVKGTYDWKYDDTQILRIAKTYSSKEAIERQTINIINTAIKNVIGQYNIDNIVKDQDAIANASRALASARLNTAGIPIIITALNLNNWDWSEDYDAMIKRTVAMQQDTLRAEAEVKMIEQQAAQKKVQAEADAAASIAAAEGRKRTAELDAQARLIEANSIAEANRVKAQPASMEFQKAQWNYEVALERAKRLAPGTDVPLYIPLAPNGTAAVLQPSQPNR